MVQPWQLSIISLIPLIAAGISFLIAISAWQKRNETGNLFLAGLMVAIAVWSIFDTFEKSSVTITAKVFWAQIQYLGIVSTPVLFLLFSASYSKANRWFSKRNIALLWVIPVITLIIVATNRYHMWHWSAFTLDQDTNLLIYSYGPWFWFYASYAYIILLVATILLIKSTLQFQGHFRKQAWIIIIAALIPWAANIIYLFRLFPIQGIDPTPLAFTISGFLITISVSDFRLIDLTPIARVKLVDTLQDALIVVDSRGSISDLNPAASNIIRIPINQAIGKPATQILQQWPYLAYRFSNPTISPTEMVLIPDIDKRWYDARISPLTNENDQLNGYLIILRDITEKRKAEAERALLAAVIEQANETILITDLDGNIIYANPYYAKISGYSIDQAIEINPNLLESKHHEKEKYEKLKSTVKGGNIWTGTLVNKRIDGNKYFESATIFPIKNKNGTITNYAAVKRDITARIQAEGTLRIFSDHLKALHEVSIELSLLDSFDDLCRQVVLLGHQRLGFDRIGLWFVDSTDPNYLLGSFGIDQKSQLQDWRGRRYHLSTFPGYRQFAQNKGGIVFNEDVPLRNEKSEILGRGENAIAGMWDKDKIIGYLTIDNLTTRKRITEQQKSILVLFSQTVGNLFIRKIADNALQSFSEHLSNLHDVTIELSQADTFDRMCQLAVHLGRNRLGFDRLSIWFVDSEDNKFIKGSYGVDENGNLVDKSHERQLIESDPILKLLFSGTPRVFHQQNVDLLDSSNQNIGRGDFAASALWDGSKIIGYLKIDNLITQKPFANHQLDLLVLFAQSVGNLSTRIKAAEETRRRARQQAMLNEITRTAIEQSDFQVMLQTLADQLGQLYHADGCFITLWDEEKKLVLPGAAFGPFKDRYISDLGIQPEMDEATITNTVLNSKQVVVIEDVLNSPHLSKRLAREFPACSILGLPLVTNEQKLGAAIISFTEFHDFQSDEITLGEQVAQQIALAILKTRSLNNAEIRAKEAETLRQASAAVVATLKRDEAIERILEELNRVVPYDSASVQLLLGNELEIVGERGFEDPNSVIGLRFPSTIDTPNAVLFEKGEPLIIEDAPLVYEAFKKPPLDRIHGWMGVPLKVHERIIGLLALDSIQPGRFTKDHSRLATAFADQVAIALENTRLFEETQWLATHDSLTGLFNRRHFMSLAWGEFKRADRYKTPLSAIMLDIDHFKRVNDTYGHQIGDHVLQFIANICKNNLRIHDIIGRYGGEEFIILLPETSATSSQNLTIDEIFDIEPAKIVADRLRTAVEKEILQAERGGIRITISLGIAELSPEITNIEQLIDCADQALLKAKQTGRNRIIIWNQEF